MEPIKFECESITPVFMYGADGSTPELRPASIKGVLRFWWRAIHGDLELEKLHKQESEIFGSTDRKSSFCIKVDHHDFKDKKEIPEKFKFEIEFLSPNKSDFDVKSFFELVVLFGFFGQKGKASQKQQGSIKILKFDGSAYSKKFTLELIFGLLQKHCSNCELNGDKITLNNLNTKYPAIDTVSIDNSTLSIAFKNSVKIKTIKKDLGEYHSV